MRVVFYPLGVSFVFAMVGCAGSTDDNDANGAATPGADETIGTTDWETDTNSDFGNFDPGAMLPDCGGEDVVCFRLVSLWSRTPLDGAVAIDNARLVVIWQPQTVADQQAGKFHVGYDVPFTPSSNTFGVPLKAIAGPQAEQMWCHRTCSQCACTGPSFGLSTIVVMTDENENGQYDRGQDEPFRGFGSMIFVNSDACGEDRQWRSRLRPRFEGQPPHAK